jgi:hypothetical protein
MKEKAKAASAAEIFKTRCVFGKDFFGKRN